MNIYDHIFILEAWNIIDKKHLQYITLGHVYHFLVCYINYTLNELFSLKIF